MCSVTDDAPLTTEERPVVYAAEWITLRAYRQELRLAVRHRIQELLDYVNLLNGHVRVETRSVYTVIGTTEVISQGVTHTVPLNEMRTAWCLRPFGVTTEGEFIALDDDSVWHVCDIRKMRVQDLEKVLKLINLIM